MILSESYINLLRNHRSFMTLDITFSTTPRAGADTVIVGVYEGKKAGDAAHALDKKTGGLIATALKSTRKFSGKAGENFLIALPAKAGYAQAVLLGLGKQGALDALKAEALGGRLLAALSAYGTEKAVFLTEKMGGKAKDFEIAGHIAAGAQLRSYKFERYKSKDSKASAAKPIGRLNIAGPLATKAQGVYKDAEKVVRGVFSARDLVNEPPNVLYPSAYAERVRKTLSPLGIKVTVLDDKQIAKLGMGAILGVGQGSDRKPRMVIMEWAGGKKSKAKNGQNPVALVGKGVTFDTGGISIKPAAGMEEMKMDMAGSAAVVGTMQALALRKSKAYVVGIIGLAENMPSSNAYRPGDILKSYSGKTIEVLNTDAEGRLVLADALTYVQRKFKPRAIIDLATLTGAMMVALGHEYCGTFANDDKLWSQLEKSSAATGEKLWRMPLDEVWKAEMVSQTADLQNLGHTGRYGGACTAAGFLEHFIENKTPWAHLDIAGTAWIKKDRPTVPRNGTGFGVRLLDRLIADHYE
jgi:leucyl aminopeptidase